MSPRIAQTVVAVAALAAWVTLRALGIEDGSLSTVLPLIGAWLAPSPATMAARKKTDDGDNP